MIVHPAGRRTRVAGTSSIGNWNKLRFFPAWLMGDISKPPSQRFGIGVGHPPILHSPKEERLHALDSRALQQDFLAYGPHALPPELQNRTTVLDFRKDVWWEKAWRSMHLSSLAVKSQALRRAWALFRASSRYSVVVTTGTLDGLAFGFLQKFRGRRRPFQLMYDCMWYGGSWMKRLWMRACLRQVDRCVVWASAEAARYSKAYNVPREKFVFVPHHHSLRNYTFEVGDKGYIFAGGNSDRDYGPFLESVRDLPVRCIVATTLPGLLRGKSVPSNVQVVGATPSEFRQLMADSRIVVVPMQADLLRTGGQQTFLNAMYMGKPVILTDPQGGADYIEDGKTGILVPPGDSDALRGALAFLWNHPEEARVIGERSREVATPLTTERCNIEIWGLGIELLRKSSALESQAAVR